MALEGSGEEVWPFEVNPVPLAEGGKIEGYRKPNDRKTYVDGADIKKRERYPLIIIDEFHSDKKRARLAKPKKIR